MLALVPYIILATAYELFRKQVGTDLRIGRESPQIISAAHRPTCRDYDRHARWGRLYWLPQLGRAAGNASARPVDAFAGPVVLAPGAGRNHRIGGAELLVRTRSLPVLSLSGMLLLIGGGVRLFVAGTHVSSAVWLIAVGLLGLGAGATVSPGLWMAGFSLPSQMVGRTFALVELVRSEADFILAPLMLQVAQVSSGGSSPRRPALNTPSGSRF